MGLVHMCSCDKSPSKNLLCKQKMRVWAWISSFKSVTKTRSNLVPSFENISFETSMIYLIAEILVMKPEKQLLIFVDNIFSLVIPCLIHNFLYIFKILMHKLQLFWKVFDSILGWKDILNRILCIYCKCLGGADALLLFIMFPLFKLRLPTNFRKKEMFSIFQ